MKRENEMTPLDAAAGDLSQLTNPRRIVNFKCSVDIHAATVERVTVHRVNMWRPEIVSL
jgi:hypothetical protein